MTLHARKVAWLLPLVLTACLTACVDKAKQMQPQQFAPPVSTVPKPPVMHPELPESLVAIDTQPLDTDTDTILEEAAKPAVRRRRPPVKAAPAEVTDSAAQPANAPPTAPDNSEVPAIGELSSGGGASDLRRETADSITGTERGLKALGRPLNGQEQKTAAQIRQFIRQARKALISGDVDGASTLAAKAKVLLGELSE